MRQPATYIVIADVSGCAPHREQPTCRGRAAQRFHASSSRTSSRRRSDDVLGPHSFGSTAETSVAAPALEWYLAEGATHGNSISSTCCRTRATPTAAGAHSLSAARRRAGGTDLHGARRAAVSPSGWTTMPGLARGRRLGGHRQHEQRADHRRAGDVHRSVERPWLRRRPRKRRRHRAGDAVVPRRGRDRAVLRSRSSCWPTRTSQPAEVRRPICSRAARTSSGLHGAPATAGRRSTSTARIRCSPTPRCRRSSSRPNDVPIVVERAMWWPRRRRLAGGAQLAGSTVTGEKWGLAEGESGGAAGNTHTYILIANTERRRRPRCG